MREGTITNFVELSRQFTDQFVANRRIVRDLSHLSAFDRMKENLLRTSFAASPQRYVNSGRRPRTSQRRIPWRTPPQQLLFIPHEGNCAQLSRSCSPGRGPDSGRQGHRNTLPSV
ncbi:hypothetical protein KSP40_PGU004659 [Platanthera guangdongensis]|uniref:Uncharacterized protein n=1 Tax=Platanthera guangdongensis TaxID=2320717 RepID=A0ABR2LGR7_9ASPA